MKKSVLFLCTMNSCRSQMAEGLLRHYYGEKFEAYSAGVQCSTVNSKAIQVMQELGIDISNHHSKSIREFKGQEFDWVITVCDNAKQSCPRLPAKEKELHWSIPDPFGAHGNLETVMKSFRKVRDLLKKKIDQAVLD